MSHATPTPTADPVAVLRKALNFAADTIELFDDATMRADYMLDSTQCAGIIRALVDSPQIIAMAATDRAAIQPAEFYRQGWYDCFDAAREQGLVSSADDAPVCPAQQDDKAGQAAGKPFYFVRVREDGCIRKEVTEARAIECAKHPDIYEVSMLYAATLAAPEGKTEASELPPLPAPHPIKFAPAYRDFFTADQMHAYASAALAARPPVAAPDAEAIYQCESETSEGCSCWMDTTKGRYESAKSRGFNVRTVYPQPSPAVKSAESTDQDRRDLAAFRVTMSAEPTEGAA
jgi:hypothetical protein